MTTVKVLNALDALDRHSFERVDGSNSLDTLYSKIFPVANNTKDKDNNQEEARVQYVCKKSCRILSGHPLNFKTLKLFMSRQFFQMW